MEGVLSSKRSGQIYFATLYNNPNDYHDSQHPHENVKLILQNHAYKCGSFF
jgi:phosphatidylserine decarboxylase